MEESGNSEECSKEISDSEPISDGNSLEAMVNDESVETTDNPEEREYESAKLSKDYSLGRNNPRYRDIRLASGKPETAKPAQEEGDENPAYYKIKGNRNLRLVSAKSGAHGHTIERTDDGAVALIYFKNEATGRTEILFEQRPADDRHGPGKLSLIGGAIDIVDGRKESSLETLMRELDEEISDESSMAKEIIRNTLDATRELYTIIPENVHGNTAFTYVYSIRIQSAKDWDIVKRAYLTNDAGTARILSGGQVKSTPRQDFAFSFGDTVLGFVSDKMRINSYLGPPGQSWGYGSAAAMKSGKSEFDKINPWVSSKQKYEPYKIINHSAHAAA